MPFDMGGLSLATSSSAKTGDTLNDQDFMADFGDNYFDSPNAGEAGGSSPITGLVNDLVKGVLVALLAKWAWNELK